MSRRYHKGQYAFLEALVHLSPEQLKTVISHLDEGSVNYICDIIFKLTHDPGIDTRISKEKKKKNITVPQG